MTYEPVPDEEGGGELRRLQADGLIQRVDGVYRTTTRWQTAMARSALRLYRQGARDDDLRVPVASALVELYGNELHDEEMARLVEALLPIEAVELRPP